MKIKDITQKQNKEIKIEDNFSYLITSSQKSIKSKISPKKTFVLVPNFIEYSRLLSSGKYKDCINKFRQNMSFGKTMFLNMKNFISLAPLSGIFWSAILEMAIIDLSSLKKNENIILHPLVIDLAFHSGRKAVIKKLVSIAKQATRGNIGLWTRNINLVLSKTSLENLGIDFLVTPFNKFNAGVRMNKDLLIERLKTEKIPLIRDYVSHFQSFINKIKIEDNSLII